jgi:hypothetical protein
MCLTAEAFLALVPAFSAVGGASTGTIEWIATGTIGDTIDIGGVQLTAVAGARTAGSNTWSIDGSDVAEATSFVAAIADSDATAIVSAEKTTPTIVELTTVGFGYDSELALSTSAPLVYTLSGDAMDGGSDLLDFTLQTTCLMINASVWGTKAGAAQAYLTAHFMAIATGAGGGETGASTSRTIAQISQSNASTAFDTSDAAYASTKWGRLYLALRATVINFGMMTSARGCFGLVGGGGW